MRFPPGLTIIRGPNEAGKTTIARAIELGLTGSLAAPSPIAVDGLRSWDAEPDARPTVSLDFTLDPTEAGGPGRSGTVEKAFGPGGSTTTST